jgi:HEAT repeat protein
MSKLNSPATPPIEQAALDKAFADLQTFGWGSSRGLLMPIDEAIPQALECPEARRDLEGRLIAVLRAEAPPPAKDYACRKLCLAGSHACVPVLRNLLMDKDVGNAARAALEVIPGREASRALRESLPRLAGVAKVGVINSLGARRELENAPALMDLLADPDPAIASAAAWALGALGNGSAAKSLQKAPPEAANAFRTTITDALLACAERMLKEGQRADAVALYRSLSDKTQPKHVQLAARRGLLMAAQSK